MKFRDIATIVVLGSSFFLYDVYTSRPRIVAPEVTYVSSRATESVRETSKVKTSVTPKKPMIKEEPELEEVYVYTFTPEEEEILLNIAMAEAESEGRLGKALVMQVVINRVESEDFPNSIEEVVYQPKQFTPVSSGSYGTKVPDEQCYKALEEIKRGDYTAIVALYFNNLSQSWASTSRKYLYTVGNHNFYR